jgi:two-component system uhpT operon response regulator UhpA
MSQQLRLAIVDDHEAIRLGFLHAAELSGHHVAFSTPSVSELIGEVSKDNCDIAVLDLSLADGSNVASNVAALVAKGVPVIIFSIADKQNLVRAALRAGAAGLVAKSNSMDELFRAIIEVAAGNSIDNTQTAAAIDADLDFKEANLSSREREVLSLYASGLAQKQVANFLGISQHTVKEHIVRVRRKYEGAGRPIENKTDWVRRALEDGLLADGVL